MCLHNASTFGLATVRFSNLLEVNADVLQRNVESKEIREAVDRLVAVLKADVSYLDELEDWSTEKDQFFLIAEKLLLPLCNNVVLAREE